MTNHVTLLVWKHVWLYHEKLCAPFILTNHTTFAWQTTAYLIWRIIWLILYKIEYNAYANPLKHSEKIAYVDQRLMYPIIDFYIKNSSF